jgi:hypothetical protein
MSRQVAGTTLALVVLAATGCGGSKPVTRAEFVARLDVACRHTRADVATAFSNHDRSSKAVLRARWIAALRRLDRNVSAIASPTQGSAPYDAYKSALREEVDAEIRFASGIRSALGEQERATHRATQLAEQLNLNTC